MPVVVVRGCCCWLTFETTCSALIAVSSADGADFTRDLLLRVQPLLLKLGVDDLAQFRDELSRRIFEEMPPLELARVVAQNEAERTAKEEHTRSCEAAIALLKQREAATLLAVEAAAKLEGARLQESARNAVPCPLRIHLGDDDLVPVGKYNGMRAADLIASDEGQRYINEFVRLLDSPGVGLQALLDYADSRKEVIMQHQAARLQKHEKLRREATERQQQNEARVRAAWKRADKLGYSNMDELAEELFLGDRR